MKIARRQFNKSMTYLVVSNEEDQEEFLIDETAKTIREKSDEAIEARFRQVNDFFQTLPKQAKWKLMYFYKQSCADIIAGKDYQVVIYNIGAHFAELCKDLNLLDKLIPFIVFSPLMQQCQTQSYQKPQEVAHVKTQLTNADAIAIMAITILCKMLFPIWSFLRTTKIITHNDPELILENMLETILKGSILEPTFEKVRTLTQEYGSHVWWQYAAASGDRTITAHANNTVFASLWTKRQANIDLTYESGSVIVWVTVCLKQSHNSLLGKILQERKSSTTKMD